MLVNRSLSFLSTALLVSALAPAQVKDAYWQASRMSKEVHRVSSCGQVDLVVDLTTNNFPATTAPSLRSAHVAPDGQVWVVNFIVAHFTMFDDDGTNIRNIPIVSGARPYDCEFGSDGNTYLSGGGEINVFDSNGSFIKTIAVGGNPLGLSSDSDGNIWACHRMNAPSKVTKIDVKTHAWVDYTFPAGTNTLGGQVRADFQGLFKKSHIYCLGDRSSDLIHFDSDGNHLGTYVIDPNSTTISAMAIDKDNNIWIGNYRNPSIFKFDTVQKKVTNTIFSPPNTLGLRMDSKGRLLATARVSFSGPEASEVRRFNTDTYDLEQVAMVGMGAGSAASSNFHNALVVDPIGDVDGDGVANYQEIQILQSSAFDAQSNDNTNLRVDGPNARGGKVKVRVEGKAGAQAFVGIAAGTTAPVCVGAWTGCLKLDLNLLVVALPFTVPATLPITIPNDPNLIGLGVHFQGLYDVGAPKAAWSNVECIYIYQ